MQFAAVIRRGLLLGGFRSVRPVVRPRYWPCKSTIQPSRLISSPPYSRRKDVPTVDTIYALSTAPGRAAIAIVRISGPACLDIYGALCPDNAFPIPRVATLRKLYSPRPNHEQSRVVLDSGALVLYFTAPATVTGEDILELHVHGGPAIVRSILSAIPQSQPRDRRRTAHYSTIRHAEPGEFTKRAFYNGRISLPDAESLGSLLAAETEQQRRLAVLGAESGLAERYETWRQMLLYARGELEALIDFSEDQHFDESPAQFISSISAQVQAIVGQLRLHIQNASRGELLRSGIRVALLGAPNAGKSSLLNRIVGREAAIVSAEEGTTRDIVDVSVDLNGWLVRLGDMAGLRTTPNSSAAVPTSGTGKQIGEIEKEGIRRARARALDSDVVIVLLSLEPRADGSVGLHMNDEVRAAAKDCQAAGKTLVVAINKSDLIPGIATSEATKAAMRRYVYNALPGLSSKDVHFLSCTDAAASATSPSSATPALEDPMLLQAFVTNLTRTFRTMTAAITAPDSESEATQTHPAEAQAYYTASLSVTHRQTIYLAECLGHLEDFLAQTLPQSISSPFSDLDGHAEHQFHQDNHDDLVHPRTTQPTMESRVEDEFEAQTFDTQVDIVTAAEHLRYAAACLSKITGRGGEDGTGHVEDVLGVVFEK